MKQIINQYKNNIKKIIYTMTGAENEDIEQEVCIRVWKNRENYKEQGRFKSWISTITANLCRDYLKSSYFKHASMPAVQEDEILNVKDTKEDIESSFISKQRQQKIIEAVDNLKPKLKEAVIMYEMQGMSYEEISEKLKIPAGTVKSRLFSARKELSIVLKDLI